jgi:predicted dienelactone hydrolase
MVTLVLAGVLMTFATMGPTAQSSDRSSGPVGFATRKFVPAGDYNWRGARTHALITSIWYPAVPGTPMKPQILGPPEAPLFIGGDWAEGAKPAPGKHPLIMLSHGTGGTADSLAWLARALAARGFIVAGPNHPGNTALEPYTAEGFLLWWERARDLTSMLDALLEDAGLAPSIDVKRVGVAGFSLGGYTAFVLAGARTDPQRLLDYCATPNAEGCGDPPEFPNLFARWKEMRAKDARFQALEGRAAQSRADERVRAAFAIAPAIAQTFVPDSLKNVRVPIEIVVGAADTLAPPTTNAQYLASATGGKLTVLPGGVAHYTFLARCTDQGRRELPDLCSDAPGVDRRAIHEQAAKLATSFFDRALR